MNERLASSVTFGGWAFGIAMVAYFGTRLGIPWPVLLIGYSIHLGISACYWLVPFLLSKRSLGHRYFMPLSQIMGTRFSRFIWWCGQHHSLHPPFMLMAMFGWHSNNTMELWIGLAGYLFADGCTLYHSLMAARDFKKEADD